MADGKALWGLYPPSHNPCVRAHYGAHSSIESIRESLLVESDNDDEPSVFAGGRRSNVDEGLSPGSGGATGARPDAPLRPLPPESARPMHRTAMRPHVVTVRMHVARLPRRQRGAFESWFEQQVLATRVPLLAAAGRCWPLATTR